MNRDNKPGVLMWRDDQVESYNDGTKRMYPTWYIRTQCWTHSEVVRGERFPKNPAYCILKATPYRGTVHLSCIEARYIYANDGASIDCKNMKCPHYDEDLDMNETEYLLIK